MHADRTRKESDPDLARLLGAGYRSICLLALLLVFAAPTIRAASLEGLGAPQLFWRDGEGLTPAVLMASALEIDVLGTAAEVRLTQTFTNTDVHWAEAVYALPLPDEAAVHGLVMTVDGRRIIGVVREKQEARIVYQQARAEGRRAGLLEHIDAQLFTVRAANIDPGATVQMEIAMTMPVAQSGHTFALRFPTTITPRYTPGTTPDPAFREPALWPGFAELGGPRPLQRGASTDPLIFSREPHHPLDLTVSLRPSGRLVRFHAPLHTTRLTRVGDAWQVGLRNGPAAMDRDVVIRWQVAADAEPTPLLQVEAFADQYFAALEVLPPADAAAPPPLPRELILVLDTSGSMAGDAIAQARDAAAVVLGQLTPADALEVIAFNHEPTALFGGLVDADPGAIAAAQDFVAGLEADGGTEMGPALALALDLPAPLPGNLRQVLFVTDGAVWAEAALFRQISDSLGAARLFTVAIGAAPNSAFMRRAAEVGRGLHRHVTTVDEVGPAMLGLLQTMSRPVLTDIEVDWPQSAAAAANQLSDLYRGEPLRQRVRLDGPPAGGVVTVRGLLGGVPWQRELALPSPPPGNGAGALARLWARERVATLLDAAQLDGLPQEAVRGAVLPLALDFALATPFTSFVAVEQSVARPPHLAAGRHRLPLQTPAGAHRFAQTATAAGTWLYLGLFGLFMALFTWVMAREGQS